MPPDRFNDPRTGVLAVVMVGSLQVHYRYTAICRRCTSDFAEQIKPAAESDRLNSIAAVGDSLDQIETLIEMLAIKIVN